MTYLAALIFLTVIAGGIVWFLCECFEQALDVEGD